NAVLAHVSAAASSASPYQLAVLGINTQQHPLQALKTVLNQLQQLHCQVLLLCSTSDFAIFQSNLGRPFCEQMLSKPACHHRLQHAINDLLCIKDEPLPPSVAAPEQYALHALCVDDNQANLLLIKTLLADLKVRVSVA